MTEKSTQPIRVAYVIANEDILTPLLKRQVIELLVKETELAEGELQVSLMLFQSLPSILRRWRRLMILKKLLAANRIGLAVIPNPCPWPIPNVGFIKTDVGYRPYSYWNRFAACCFSIYAYPFIMYNYLTKRNIIFHSRSYPPAYAINTFKKHFPNARHIFDPRSDFPEESVVAGRWTSSSKDFSFWKKAEVNIITNSSYTACISNSYQKHYEKFSGKFLYVIAPNNVNSEKFRFSLQARHEKRSVLDILESDIVFVYLGGMTKNGWHRPESYKTFFESIKTAYHNAKLLMLVQPHANEFLRRVFGDRKDMIIVNPGYDDVAAWLSLADFGLMYTHKRRLAVGTKIGEYLSTGLPIICNANCLGTVAFLEKHPNAGIVYNIGLGDLDTKVLPASDLNFDRILQRNDLVSLARRIFDNNSVAAQYVNIYRSLANT